MTKAKEKQKKDDTGKNSGVVPNNPDFAAAAENTLPHDPEDSKDIPDTDTGKKTKESKPDKEQKGSGSGNGKKEDVKFKPRAKELFGKHKVDQLYFTADGQAFVEAQFARMHSENLKDHTVVTIKRSEV